MIKCQTKFTQMCLLDITFLGLAPGLKRQKSKSLKRLYELASFRVIDEKAISYKFCDSEVDGKFVAFNFDSQLSWPFMIFQRFTLLLFPDWL